MSQESPAGKVTTTPAQRTAVILQPSYFPWIGYFAQMARADVFVVYDDVQYDKHSWRNRNRIKSSAGPQWLTVPVRTHGRDQPTNRGIHVDNAQNWRRKHLLSIQQNYSKALYFAQYFPVFEQLFAREWDLLIDLNLAAFSAMNEALGLVREIKFSSELGCEGASVERLIALCHTLGATRFYEGSAGRDYIDDSLFRSAGIEIEYQDYPHPTYPQLHGDFVSHLSIIDLLFNCGPKSMEVLAV